jgi:hypothetical protein
VDDSLSESVCKCVSEEGDVTDLYDDAAQLHHEPIPARRAVTLHVHYVLVRALAEKEERTYMSRML